MANPAKGNIRTGTFGAFGQAANHQVMDSFPNYFVTEDATPTNPNKSPINTVSNIAPFTILIPASAVEMTIRTNHDLRVSEDPNMAAYFVIPASGEDTFPCVAPDMDNVISNTGSIYLQSDTTAAIVSFKFHCV